MTEKWRAMTVDVSARGDPLETARRLRRLEVWFAKYHRPLTFFRPDGRPRSQVICLAVPVEESAKALAFKAMCMELGIGASISQWLISSHAGTSP